MRFVKRLRQRLHYYANAAANETPFATASV
jgi:hypothetical protein